MLRSLLPYSEKVILLIQHLLVQERVVKGSGGTHDNGDEGVGITAISRLDTSNSISQEVKRRKTSTHLTPLRKDGNCPLGFVHNPAPRFNIEA